MKKIIIIFLALVAGSTFGRYIVPLQKPALSCPGLISCDDTANQKLYSAAKKTYDDTITQRQNILCEKNNGRIQRAVMGVDFGEEVIQTSCIIKDKVFDWNDDKGFIREDNFKDVGQC